ncbi:hypothetical protein IMZ48_26385, partial [Candidatus Bathyarchaeota archaeon]|nr:hypothetical protein [Candidatus Bathyarchaeota archaeon]
AEDGGGGGHCCEGAEEPRERERVVGESGWEGAQGEAGWERAEESGDGAQSVVHGGVGARCEGEVEVKLGLCTSYVPEGSGGVVRRAKPVSGFAGRRGATV